MTSTLVTDLHNVLDPPKAVTTPPANPQLALGNWEYDYWSGRPKSSYSSPYSGRPIAGYSVGSANKKVKVLYPDGTEKDYTVPYDCLGWFTIAASVWPSTETTVQVPIEHCQFSYKEPVFNACVYTATNEYMQARWGRRLDDSDRRWLAAHPLVTDSGVPQEYTATCVDQLTQPYGLRVSRIRLRKGSLVLGDSIMQWIHALGCNPFALADRSTSNAEAAERMGLSLEQANAIWRVEFSEHALPCSIVGERGWTNNAGVSTGNFGGHARYLAPRAAAGDWFISVQLEPEVMHLMAPPDPEYVPRKGEATLLLGSVTDPQGAIVAVRSGTAWRRPTDPEPKTVTTTYAPTVSPSVIPTFTPPRKTTTTAGNTCLLCGDSKLMDVDMYPTTRVCMQCVDLAWEPYRCGHCKTEFVKVGAPDFLGFDEKEYEWRCPTCKESSTVPIDDVKDDDDRRLLEMCMALVSDADLLDDYPHDVFSFPDELD